MGLLYYLGSTKARVVGYTLSFLLSYGTLELAERTVETAVDKAAYVAFWALARAPSPRQLLARHPINPSTSADVDLEALVEDGP